MRLFIDGDAFPNLLKPIVLRAIDRLSLTTFVIANKPVVIGPSRHIRAMVVNAGIDEADNRIAEMIEEGDLLITADIPLADRAISKKAQVINHHGHTFTEANIKDCLAMRDLMHGLRDSGTITGGALPFRPKDVVKFANAFSNILSRCRPL